MAKEGGPEKPIVAFLGPKASYTHQVGAVGIIFASLTSLVTLTRVPCYFLLYTTKYYLMYRSITCRSMMA